VGDQARRQPDQKAFDEGLASADAVIIVVSSSSVSKPWVREELDAAMVRRITKSTRLIPIRLDQTEMPEPLQHLLWVNADPSEAGVEYAARQIADRLHGRSMKPAIASAPQYAATVPIRGLTSSDTTLLTLLAQEAIAAESLLALPWQRINVAAEGTGLAGDAVHESLAALEQRSFVKVKYVAGSPHMIELKAIGFDRCIDRIITGAESVRQKIIASLLNEPPSTFNATHDLAELTSTPLLFVVEYLKRLRSKRYIGLSLTLGGYSRVYEIKPTLKRFMTE
jgi:TIR domain